MKTYPVGLLLFPDIGIDRNSRLGGGDGFATNLDLLSLVLGVGAFLFGVSLEIVDVLVGSDVEDEAEAVTVASRDVSESITDGGDGSGRHVVLERCKAMKLVEEGGLS